MNGNCEGCYYRRPLAGKEGITACHFSLDTGRLRGCPANHCTQKITEREFKQHTKAEADFAQSISPMKLG